jgi:hypothetical protein
MLRSLLSGGRLRIMLTWFAGISVQFDFYIGDL